MARRPSTDASLTRPSRSSLAPIASCPMAISPANEAPTAAPSYAQLHLAAHAGHATGCDYWYRREVSCIGFTLVRILVRVASGVLSR